MADDSSSSYRHCVSDAAPRPADIQNNQVHPAFPHLHRLPELISVGRLQLFRERIAFRPRLGISCVCLQQLLPVSAAHHEIRSGFIFLREYSASTADRDQPWMNSRSILNELSQMSLVEQVHRLSKCQLLREDLWYSNLINVQIRIGSDHRPKNNKYAGKNNNN